MQVSFETERLRDLCEDPQRALEVFPEVVCVALEDRLADLDAADSMAELVVGEPLIDPQAPGQVRYDLPEGFELVCVGNDPGLQSQDNGTVPLDRLRRVRVLRVGEAHL